MHAINNEYHYEIQRAFIVWSLISMSMVGLVVFGFYHAMTSDDEPEELRDVTSLVRGDDWAILNQNPFTHHVQEDWE